MKRTEKFLVYIIVCFIQLCVLGTAYPMSGPPGGQVAGTGGSGVLNIIPIIFLIGLFYVFYKYVNSLVNIVIGIVVLICRFMFFKEIPLIGTVFSMPGDNILKAEVIDARILYVIYLYAAIFISIGAYKLYLNRLNSTTIPENTFSNMSLDKIKEAKQLLDEGSITDDEFNKIKEKVLK